jgi:hydroxyethylthiazole kinase
MKARKGTTAGAARARPAVNVYGERTAEILERVRALRPMIHHITNWVVMNDTANATLALGALPVMAHAREEVEEMASVAGALVLNPGTLYPELVDAMLMAGRRANERDVPVVYDPVGVGATRFRNETGARILKDLRIGVIRGNSGEIGALAGAGGVVKGVDSVEGVADPQAVARDLALRRATTVAITGKRDILSDGTRVLGVDNGHPLLQMVTGTGCMATTVVAVFCAVEKDRLLAATCALACYGLAAERAARAVRGPGSFRTALLDELYRTTPQVLVKGVRVVELA